MMIRPFLLSLFLFFGIVANAQFGFQRIDTINVVNGSNQTMPWAGGLDFPQFSNIDLNWDGTPDLFVFDRTCNKVLTFLHSGNAGVAEYTYAPEYQDLFPDDLIDWVFLVDYNCDGKEDIFTYSIGTIKIFKNIGDAGSGHQFEVAVQQLKGYHEWFMTDVFVSASSIDIPCFVDVDGDTDIDILNFDVSGFSVEYHKNLSMENYGNCDSLDYELKNLCWGQFRENGSSNAIELNSTSGNCGTNISNPESIEGPQRGERHAGGTTMALDMDGNGVMDLLVGDISYPNISLLMNGGTAPNQDSPMISIDTAFPSNSIPVNIDLDPAPFHVDVDNDGIRDLVVAPALKVGSENKEGVWYYDNAAADNAPVFEFVKNDFLQGEMIDQGGRSLPQYFDYNGDGLKDLLVSSYGIYDTVINNNRSMIAYYENTGTQANPEFTLVSDDWEGLSTLGLGSELALYPTFGDLDGDGDEDMVLGEYDGYLYYFQNTGGAGNQASFSSYIILNEYFAQQDSNAAIFEGIHPYPQLVDLDRDNDIDLVLGKRNGKLSYYENTGNQFAYTFEKQTSDLGMVDVSEWWNIEGHAVPQFLDIDNEYHLICGSMTGYLHYYDNIDGNLTGAWNMVDTTLEDINIGTFSAPAVYDITGDNHAEMVVGNKRGGLALYKSAVLTDVGFEENAFSDLLIYPNPASDQVIIDLGPMSYSELQNAAFKIYDMMGRLVIQQQVTSQLMTIGVGNLSSGTYLLEISNGNAVVTRKLSLQ